MKRVAVYVRVSTSDGKQSYERQIEDLKKVAHRNGYSDDEIFYFKDMMSGYIKGNIRPALNEMMNLIKSDASHFDCVYVTEISRLGRNPSHVREIMDYLTERKIPIYIQNMDQYTISNGKRNSILNIILQILMEFAHSEAEQTKSRFKSGLLDGARRGRVGGGLIYPYGFKNENQYLVVDNEEAQIVRTIFDMYQKGNGSKFISNYLNNNKIPTRYNKAFEGKKLNLKNYEKDIDSIIWSDSQVLSLIKNTIYKGERNFKGEIFEIEPIITKELFDECQNIRQKKTHRNFEIKYDYLLKDLLVCGCCGRNYFAKYKPVPHGDKVYMCSSRLLKGGNCGNVGVNISYLESAIFDLLITSGGLSNQIKNKDTMLVSVQNEMFKKEQNVLTITNELVSLNEALNRTTSAYLMKGGLSENEFLTFRNDINETIEALTVRLGKNKTELLEQKNVLIKLKSVDSTKNFFNDLKNDRKKIIPIFREFINKIIITKVDDQYVVANVFLTIDGNIMKQSLMIILDMKIPNKRKNKIFNYGLTSHIKMPVSFDKNILIGDKNEIVEIYQRSKSLDKINDFKQPHVIISWHDVPYENVFVL